MQWHWAGKFFMVEHLDQNDIHPTKGHNESSRSSVDSRQRVSDTLCASSHKVRNPCPRKKIRKVLICMYRTINVSLGWSFCPLVLGTIS